MARPKKPQEITIPDSIYCLQPIKEVNGKKFYRDNPFITPSNFSIEVRKDLTIVGGGLEIKDEKGTDIEVQTGIIGKIQHVDKEQFIKLYISHLALFFRLSKTAQNALFPVTYTIQKEAQNQAHIFLPYSRAKEIYENFHNVFEKVPSKQSFSLGMKTLIKVGFLAAHYYGDSWYWFNPNFCFNGDRVRFVWEYRTKRDEEKKKEKLDQYNLLNYVEYDEENFEIDFVNDEELHRKLVWKELHDFDNSIIGCENL